MTKNHRTAGRFDQARHIGVAARQRTDDPRVRNSRRVGQPAGETFRRVTYNLHSSPPSLEMIDPVI